MSLLHKIIFLRKYLMYLFTAKTKHGIHSPFVYELLTKVIQGRSRPSVFDEIEGIRKELLMSNEKIVVNDLGAGSPHHNSSKRRIKDIAKKSSKSAKYCELLYRLICHFKPKNMLELGTSLGISAMYQASSDPSSKFITIEGCPQTAAVAKQNFSKLQIRNIEQVIGNFNDVLPAIINRVGEVDYVFFDGNHRKVATLNYFNLCLSKATNDSVFIFDDIHWSSEMEAAWSEIKSHSKVTVTIDLFFVGLVFFRKEQIKQDFVIKY